MAATTRDAAPSFGDGRVGVGVISPESGAPVGRASEGAAATAFDEAAIAGGDGEPGAALEAALPTVPDGVGVSATALDGGPVGRTTGRAAGPAASAAARLGGDGVPGAAARAAVVDEVDAGAAPLEGGAFVGRTAGRAAGPAGDATARVRGDTVLGAATPAVVVEGAGVVATLLEGGEIGGLTAGRAAGPAANAAARVRGDGVPGAAAPAVVVDGVGVRAALLEGVAFVGRAAEGAAAPAVEAAGIVGGDGVPGAALEATPAFVVDNVGEGATPFDGGGQVRSAARGAAALAATTPVEGTARVNGNALRAVAELVGGADDAALLAEGAAGSPREGDACGGALPAMRVVGGVAAGTDLDEPLDGVFFCGVAFILVAWGVGGRRGGSVRCDPLSFDGKTIRRGGATAVPQVKGARSSLAWVGVGVADSVRCACTNEDAPSSGACAVG